MCARASWIHVLFLTGWEMICLFIFLLAAGFGDTRNPFNASLPIWLHLNVGHFQSQIWMLFSLFPFPVGHSMSAGCTRTAHLYGHSNQRWRGCVYPQSQQPAGKSTNGSFPIPLHSKALMELSMTPFCFSDHYQGAWDPSNKKVTNYIYVEPCGSRSSHN